MSKSTCSFLLLIALTAEGIFGMFIYIATPLVFVAGDSGTAAYALTGGSRPRLRVAWQNGTAGTSPVLAGGLLYVYDPGGSLKIYAPSSGRELASLSAGSGHWNSPIVVGGRVIVPTGNSNDHSTSGQLIIYHLPGR